MNIFLQQTYEINKLISLSGRYKPKEFQEAVQNIVNSHKDYAIKNGEYIITTTKSLEVIDGEQVLDVEVLLPVAYRIPVDSPYTYKERIMITNALYAKVEDITMLQETITKINQYTIDHLLQPITSAYLVQSKLENVPCVEIYIGLYPNIL